MVEHIKRPNMPASRAGGKDSTIVPPQSDLITHILPAWFILSCFKIGRSCILPAWFILSCFKIRRSHQFRILQEMLSSLFFSNRKKLSFELACHFFQDLVHGLLLLLCLTLIHHTTWFEKFPQLTRAVEPFSSLAVLATMLGVYTLLVQGNINWPIKEDWKIKCPSSPYWWRPGVSKSFNFEVKGGAFRNQFSHDYFILSSVHFRWWNFIYFFTLKKWTSTAVELHFSWNQCWA